MINKIKNGHAVFHKRDNDIPQHNLENNGNDSYLTEAFKNPNVKCIYNMFVIIFISLLLHTSLTTYIQSGEINIGQNLIIKGFNNIHLLILIWSISNLLVYICYVGFTLWAHIRKTISYKSVSTWDIIGISAVVIYYLFSFYLINKMVFYAAFAPPSALISLMEHVRLMMKQHSFLRENIPKVLKYKTVSDEKLKMPNFQKLLYFTFAPVLIYEDFYPRKKKIRWDYVLRNLIELICIIFLYSLLTEKFVCESFGSIGIKYFSWSEIMLKILENTFTGILFFIIGFYVILHVVQNIIGELLKFEDRQFYKAWWTATSLSKYYRTWNILVQNWLFKYIYKDLCALFSIKNRKTALILTFLVSALVHEWIISVSFKLFMPIQFTQFFILAVLLDICGLFNKDIGNLTILYAISFGTALQVSGYSIEYFARLNCPLNDTSSIEFFKFRFMSNNCIKYF